jgi:hypothetical protein
MLGNVVDTIILESHAASIFREASPPKCWYLTTTLHGVTTQKTSTLISTTVKTSNLVREKEGRF